MSNRDIEQIRDQIEQGLADLPGLITREQLACIIGLSRRTIANCDSAKKGVANPIRIGQRVLYDKHAVIEWITYRASQHLSKGNE
jgi:hypothetical protein